MSHMRRITAHIALASMLAGSLAPYAYGRGDPAELLPPKTLAYIGAHGLIDDAVASALRAIPTTMARLGPSSDDEKQFAAVLDLVEAVGRGTVAAGLTGWRTEASVSGNTKRVNPDFAIVVDAGAQTAAVAQAVTTMLAGSNGADRIETLPIGSTQFSHDPRPDGLYWGVHASRLIVCSSPEAARQVMATLDGGKSLADSATYQAMRKAAGIEPPVGWVLNGYCDWAGLMATGRDAVTKVGIDVPPKVDQALDALGINAIRGGCCQMNASKYGMTTRTLIATDAHTGLMKLWEHEPLTDAELGMIPRDAYWVAACGLDLSGLWEETLGIIEQLAPDAVGKVQGALAMSTSVVGFSITDDLLPALGDTWILYDAPDHGGMFLTGTTLIVEVRDTDALRGIFGRLLQFLTPLLGQQHVTLEPRSVEHNGHTIDYLVLRGVPSPVAPAVCVADGYAVCALNPQVVAAVLDHLDNPAQKGTILDQADVAAVRDKLGSPLLSFYYADSRWAVRASHGLKQLLGTAFSSSAGTDYDPGLLPTLSQELAATHNMVGSCQRTKDGILYSSFGTPTMGVGANTAVIALLVSILLPRLSRARELAKRAVSGSNLRGIGQACFIYANDHNNQFPEFLEQLVAGKYIEPQMLLSPRDDDPVTFYKQVKQAVDQGNLTPDRVKPGMLGGSYVYIAGQSANDPARNVLAYERIFDDGGTNVIFLDGSVQWLKLPDFEHVLRETYKRLGRENEIPPEFRE